MRMRSRVEPAGGLSWSMRIRSVLHDPYEVGHLLDHAASHRRVRVFDDLVELSESEGAHRRSLTLRATDRAADELELHPACGFSHWSGPRTGAPATARRLSEVKPATAQRLSEVEPAAARPFSQVKPATAQRLSEVEPATARPFSQVMQQTARRLAMVPR